MENKVEKPKISVIMPVYNAEKYLRMALESVLNQTLKEVEIICVDDGSTDRSYEILEKYAQKDSRIILLHQDNQYAGAARNYGMSVASGEYLIFLDADDYFRPTMLEKAYKMAEATKPDIVIFGGEFFQEKTEDAYPYPALLRKERLPEGSTFYWDEISYCIFNITTPSPWNKLFRKDFVLEKGIQFQKTKRVNDAYFVELALFYANKISIVEEDLICYRTNNALSLQGTNNESPGLFAQVIISAKQEMEKSERFKKAEKSWKAFCLSFCIYNLESLSDADSFKLLYEDLKRRYFKEFGLEGTREDDYYDRYAFREYQYIQSHDAVDYLMKKYLESKNRYSEKKSYLFPYELVPKGSKIVLYAAGTVGKSFYGQIKKNGYCSIVAWVDKNYSSIVKKIPEVKPVEKLSACIYDYVVIAVEDKKVSDSIYGNLLNMGVEEEKIIWRFNG